jgi:hypothetical protein
MVADTLRLLPARVLIQHHRHHTDGSCELIDEEEVTNVITNGGRDFVMDQAYGTSPGSNGLNWIALSDSTLTETAASTTLSGEITGNGLARAQGTYAHTAGTSTLTVSRVFTATGAQSCRKAALFSASSGGTMNHAVAFASAKSLDPGDTLSVTFTITVST